MTTPPRPGSGHDPDARATFAPIRDDDPAPGDRTTGGRDDVVRLSDDDGRRGRGGKVVFWTLLLLGVLVAGTYAAAYAVADDKVPLGASVEGVEIGGLSPSAAEERLSEGLARRARTPIKVVVGQQRSTVDPVEAGLSLDTRATVEAAGAGRSASPVRLWRYFFGGRAVQPVVAIDDAQFEAAMAELGEGVDAQPVDGAVRFVEADGARGVRAQVTQPESGEGVDPARAGERLSQAFLTAGPVELATTELEPRITRAEVDRVMEEFVRPALSGPVQVSLGKESVLVRPAEYTRAIRIEAEGDRLEPRLVAKRFDRAVRPSLGRVSDEPRDARFVFEGGRPRLIASAPGVTYDPEEVRAGFLDVVVKPRGQRELRVAAKVDRPELTTAKARKLGVREQVSTWTTYFPYAEYRNVNLPRAAELINGTLLQPGETFSMNGIVGERTAENGFAKGFIISDGIFREDYGGGVSQIATTTFNAAFFAGLEDVEHKPHSVYIDRYPVGREATVVWGALDLRFKNDTPYGVLIKADVQKSTPSSSGVVTVSMWSTKYWDITTSESDRYDFKQPGARTLDAEDCEPASGTTGFSIDVYRYFRRAGSSALVRTEKFHTDYIASDKVTCE